MRIEDLTNKERPERPKCCCCKMYDACGPHEGPIERVRMGCPTKVHCDLHSCMVYAQDGCDSFQEEILELAT